jgi:hypothetical protein
MCDKCLELDIMISQCHILADVEDDELLQDAVELLIEKYQSDKKRLHPEQAD